MQNYYFPCNYVIPHGRNLGKIFVYTITSGKYPRRGAEALIRLFTHCGNASPGEYKPLPILTVAYPARNRKTCCVDMLNPNDDTRPCHRCLFNTRPHAPSNNMHPIKAQGSVVPSHAETGVVTDHTTHSVPPNPCVTRGLLKDGASLCRTSLLLSEYKSGER